MPLPPPTPTAVTYRAQSHYCRFMMGHSLARMDIFHFLPHFRLYGVIPLHTCVPPYKYRKILEMLPKLMKLMKPCEIRGSRLCSICCPRLDLGAGRTLLSWRAPKSNEPWRHRLATSLPGTIPMGYFPCLSSSNYHALYMGTDCLDLIKLRETILLCFVIVFFFL